MRANQGGNVNFSISSAVFAPFGEQFVVADTQGNAHIFGAGFCPDAYAETPLEQFFESDWWSVREKNSSGERGELICEETNQPANFPPFGDLGDRARVPYPSLATKYPVFKPLGIWKVVNNINLGKEFLEAEIPFIIKEYVNAKE